MQALITVAPLDPPSRFYFGPDFAKTVQSAFFAFPSVSEDTSQINELTRLEPDWDSYGALPISSEAIAQANEIISRVAWSAARQGREAHPYYIGPIPTGGVQLEWRGDDREIRIEIRPDKTLKAMFIRWDNGRKMREYQDNISEYAIPPLIVGLITTA